MLPSAHQRRWPDSPPKKDVLQLWKRNGLKPRSSAGYQRVLGVFFAYCAESQLSPTSQLSAKGCHRFWFWYVRHSDRCRDADALRQTLSQPLRAYAWAAAVTGQDVPQWKPVPTAPAWHQMVKNYMRHARDQRGLAQSGLLRDASDIERFLAYIKRRRRHWSDADV